ncbi:50S ribosomal protein L16 [archaeon]|nr:50S ribosomal protein L16 [archaeon]
MAGLRKGHCYKHITTRPYTRKSKYRRKGFIKSVPISKLARYHMGNTKVDFPVSIRLVTKEAYHIRHNSLESCRTLINRKLNESFGPKEYHFKVNIVPHQVLRENKMLTGAGADRMQSGMKHSFGKAMGLAARAKKGTTIFECKTHAKNIEIAKKYMKKAGPRLPGKVEIVVIE